MLSGDFAFKSPLALTWLASCNQQKLPGGCGGIRARYVNVEWGLGFLGSATTLVFLCERVGESLFPFVGLDQGDLPSCLAVSGRMKASAGVFGGPRYSGRWSRSPRRASGLELGDGAACPAEREPWVLPLVQQIPVTRGLQTEMFLFLLLSLNLKRRVFASQPDLVEP